MSLAPSPGAGIVLVGDFKFSAQRGNDPALTESYQLKIEFPETFPRALPKVWETGSKIPRDGKHHTNGDHSLCLGSPIGLLTRIQKKPTHVGFAENVLVPFLYAVTRKLKYGEDFYMGELAHGLPGVIADYADAFGLKDQSQVVKAVECLTRKKRVANKMPCPCECGLKLGKCPLHLKVNQVRSMAPRSWFKKHLKNLGAGM